MKIITLNKNKTCMFGVPDEGFSENFLNDLKNIVKNYPVIRGYLVLNLENPTLKDVCLIVALVFKNVLETPESSKLIEKIYFELCLLFKDDVHITIIDITQYNKVENQLIA